METGNSDKWIHVRSIQGSALIRDKTLPRPKEDTIGCSGDSTKKRTKSKKSKLHVLDCCLIGRHAKNAVYAQYKPNSVTIETDGVTGSVFGSGKMVIMGARSELQAVRAARRIARQAQKAMCPTRGVHDMGTASNCTCQNLLFESFKTNNVSASGYLGYAIDIERLSFDVRFEDEVSYEPERFPGLYMMIKRPSLKACIFHVGSVTITGAVSEKEMEEEFNKLCQLLIPFKTTLKGTHVRSKQTEVVDPAI